MKATHNACNYIKNFQEVYLHLKIYNLTLRSPILENKNIFKIDDQI